jgi:hypothetical protein
MSAAEYGTSATPTWNPWCIRNIGEHCGPSWANVGGLYAGSFSPFWILYWSIVTGLSINVVKPLSAKEWDKLPVAVVSRGPYILYSALFNPTCIVDLWGWIWDVGFLSYYHVSPYRSLQGIYGRIRWIFNRKSVNCRWSTNHIRLYELSVRYE